MRTVSFIIATFNRGPVLVDCLQRLLACGLPSRQFTVTVVDNASTDGTPDLVDALRSRHPNLRLLRLPNNCGPVAKNIAIHGNTADLLVLLDDDAYPLPGAIPRMIAHFDEDPALGAAIFDVTLPDGRKEGSAYPDVFIGAGTALRTAALNGLPVHSGGRGGRYLPADFFMQAEEYDLSFRLIAAGYSVQRFWDLPLMHLKAPGARIGQRTTRLDVRNNLYLLAKYLPQPLCHQFAADWLSRYWRMAVQRDLEQPRHPVHGTHRQSFIHGMNQGLREWARQRQDERHLLPPAAIERIFKFAEIKKRLARARESLGLQRIAFAHFGKNMLPFFQASQSLGLTAAAVVDDQLSSEPGEYRGIPLLSLMSFREKGLADAVDALVLTTLSPVHAGRQRAALQRSLPSLPVLDLFASRAPAYRPVPHPSLSL